MATVVTNELRNAQLGAPTHSVIDFNGDTISAAIIDETDSGALGATTVDYDEAVAGEVAQDDLASLTVGVVGVGIFDAADLTFSAVSGDACDYLVVYKNSGTDSTSPIAVIFDSATTGLPVTPNGGDIVVTWAAGGILAI